MIKEPLVQYSNVQLNRDENIILKDINLTVNRGDFLYIIGKVGSGKSTLLKSMYVEIPIDSGDARVFEYQLYKIKRKFIPYLRRKIGIVFQDFQLLMDRTVEKNLEFVLRATGWKDKTVVKDRINEVLVQVGMQHKTYKMPHELSGGEQQRIVIARALLNSPPLILADEPTGNLDPETGSQIVTLLHTISQKGTAVVMSTHNMSIVQTFHGRIMKCENSKLINLYEDTSLEQQIKVENVSSPLIYV
ncbi:MAG: ATP-binding cassette domain-containing protein [Dysgonamonadaceae bacterium]|jgi:cell division transport system ATP-binding protein|nr:ATP-binding cassette domain-containing protein [Dysgonamonadaceae bacterium]MDD3310186.1 ATP-binding cassette domain-containing protein [Dysgonamonadaceae bacterium]MDD3900785.1 ATP-binding cassette domain-containing protein [Dysgonamonadaceae bacterium]MDD4399472.1 ATP-binding cassette domain-containing protein [Dysgonamonadaceae bacterium]MEA5080140.1 ATP-binding cassette domain-containing protein [Dysgonamonadaceae bacterium]